MSPKRRTYHLECNPGTNLQGPNDPEIEAAIRGLPGGMPSYVILTKKKNHFMQAGGGGPENGFSLEYIEFSTDGLWEHKNSPDCKVDVEIVVKAILSYARDEEAWRDLPWERLSNEEDAARQKKLRDRIADQQPQPGFIRTVVGGLLGLALIQLGIVDDKKKRK